MNSIENLYQSKSQRYRSLKWESYLKIYDQALFNFHDREISILEFGIQNGGSLEVWGKYFFRASNIVGCDINEDCSNLTFDDNRIKVVIGDVNSAVLKNKILDIAPKYDIIVDDASHISSDIIKSFINYFDVLNSGGIYIVEDLHCSYWADYEGGLFLPTSALNFFKKIVDIINFPHIRRDFDFADYISTVHPYIDGNKFANLVGKIEYIQFYNSVCIIRKSDHDYAGLGELVPTGGSALVDESFKIMTDNIFFPDQDDNVWSSLEFAPEVKINNYENKLENFKSDAEESKLKIELYTSQVTQLQNQLARVLNSRSWKITAPLRKIKSLVMRKKR